MLKNRLDERSPTTHRLPVADGARGFGIIRNGDSGKISLDWGS